jgi:hypothetical protein
MAKHLRKIFYFATLLILAAGFLIWGLWQIDSVEKELESMVFRSYLKLKKVVPKVLPRAIDVGFVNLNIPFISQAPFAIWDELHDHACEEAAIIMVYYYLTGKELTRDAGEREILSMVDWQIKNWGGHFDLSAKQIVELFRIYYDYQNIELVYDYGVEDIKKELAIGNPIVVPAAGRALGNPYFTLPGPEYHVLVIKGYDDKKSEFIVNDPGTKRGADFRYNYQVLQNAIHDFNQGDVLSGRKAMIVVKKTFLKTLAP